MMPRLDFELVEFPLPQPRDEDLPHSRRAARPHGMAPPVPLVEVSDDAHTLGIGRPYGKADAFRVRMLEHARAKLLIQPKVGALSEQVQIKIRQNRGIAVRIVDVVGLLTAAVHGRKGNGKPVMKELRLIVEGGFEEAVLMDQAHGIRLATVENRDCSSLGLERTDHDRRLAVHGVAVNAKNVEGRAVIGANDSRHRSRDL